MPGPPQTEDNDNEIGDDDLFDPAPVHDLDLQAPDSEAEAEDAVSLPSDASVLDDLRVEEVEEAAAEAAARLLETFPDVQGPAEAAKADGGPELPEQPSSSSSAAPAAAKAVAKAGSGPGARPSGEPVVRFEVEGGVLVYYAHSKEMACFYHHAHHSDCRRTRTTDPKKDKNKGRPIGFLLAWLAKAGEHASQQDHVHKCPVSFEERVAARMNFMSLPRSEEFAENERPKRPDEPDEPLRFS